ncbi:paREP2a [Pyrobaculum aerophilum str. IM2]|uniref:PaREP2a n=1 Tax=Pyrobaculum aerophilum (strain ATCC 51768 / DSM 7523 / JCM 9630 / CIP 104966 / NBRC 100827 / IM2) TaxID=178306 RepID=Q8ZWJ1_PYRAE|nr:hypothetical protein [Pyrobaculum aerophilum]AAL63711.1 paREP2a [Pyrobaculum aerophilum str. IM2]
MTVKAVKAACVKVALPEAFSLQRKFGISWGCFTQGAFYGLDAVVAEGEGGVYFRYALPYDMSSPSSAHFGGTGSGWVGRYRVS